MKTIFVKLLTILTLLAIADAAFAQNTSVAYNFKNTTTTYSANKYLSAEADLKTLTAIRTLSSKAYLHFTRNYPAANNLKINAGRTIEIVNRVDGDLNRTTYDHKGRFMHNVRNYDHAKLNHAIATLVSDAFPRYDICSGVTEVKVLNEIVFFVLIENKKNWKRVRVFNGEMDIYEEYNK